VSDAAPQERLDSFPYRHRVGDIMSAPLATAAPDTTIRAAAQAMRARKISALVLADAGGRIDGIVTEHDVLNAVATGAALDGPIDSLATRRVVTVQDDALVYVAIGRMQRLGVRHLPVVDAAGRPVGMVTNRALIKLRAGAALALGDQIEIATDVQALKTARALLPGLARGLLDEGVDAPGVAVMLSNVLRDTTARAARLAEAALGEAPAPWAVLVLGSGGRGESLFSADQDNALVWADSAPAEADAYFARMGAMLAETLDAAGVPLCKGGVMAREAKWRGSLSEWKRRIDGWVSRPQGDSLLSVDIFYDFRHAGGDGSLSQALRTYAVAQAAKSPPFLRLLADQAGQHGTALGPFGRLRTERGKLELKRGGLLTLTSGARVMALKHGIAEVATLRRIALLAEHKSLNEDDAQGLAEALRVLMRLALDQQLADIAAGREPASRIEPAHLKRRDHRELKAALERVSLMAETVRAAF